MLMPLDNEIFIGQNYGNTFIYRWDHILAMQWQRLTSTAMGE